MAQGVIARILQAWRDVAEIKAAAKVEAAQIRAEAMLEIARMQMPVVEPEELPADLQRAVDYAKETFQDPDLIMDIAGMAEAVLGHRRESRQTVEHYRARLQKLGVPV